jgi:hypothetical protein
MRDANQITDLTFTIDEVEYSVDGIYLTTQNVLYAKLRHPIHGSWVNYEIGEIQTFFTNSNVKVDVKPNSDATRELINTYCRKNLKPV